MKTFKTRTVYFVFSLELFVFAHGITTSVAALDIFTNVYFVLLLLLVGQLIPKFHFRLTKLSLREVREMTLQKLAGGVTVLAQLRVFNPSETRSFNQ